MKIRETIKDFFALTSATGLGGATRLAARTLLATLLLAMTATTAWADNVTLSEDSQIAAGTAGHWYVNMPSGSGTNMLTLSDATVTTFKVYDDGGASGNYSDNCSGTLTLTAPTGYVLQLSGSITTERSYDKLTVYDGSVDTATTSLLDGVSSTRDGEETAITTVRSSGQSMTLYFSSDGSINYAGLDLTVTLIKLNAHSITINTATGGNVAATVGGTSASTAKLNDVVTLTATPESCYVLSGLSVTDGSGNAVAVTWDGPFYNTATFTMPNSAVTVTPTFTNTLTVDGGLYINMPATGTKSATIPAGVQSFKVYDDGGAGGTGKSNDTTTGGNYSNSCSGTLTLTAPEGYVLRLSGCIDTESADKLTVYDGSGNTATKLLDEVHSPYGGKLTDITTVTSSGQSMTLYFHSDRTINYPGLDLTVTLITRNSITVNTATGGGVAATVGGTSASIAIENDVVVTLTATPESDYLLSGLSVMDGSGNAVAVTWSGMFSNTATFIMPCSAVTVTPTFTNTWTADEGLFISMPTTGTNSFNIPIGVQSFKVHDDGGASGNYSNNCSGTLTLTAPTGYAFRLSGRINTESADKLTVYDGSDNTATKLLDEVHGLYGGRVTDITTVTSSGQSMTLYFYSDRSVNYPGLDLTVTLVATYTVSFNANGGTGDAMATQTFTYDAALALSPNAYERTGYSFAGWATTADGEVVYADGEIVSNLASTPDAKVELFAKWTKNELALLNDDSEAAEKNSGIISGAAGDGKVYEVTLTGRTLYKDGKWNTLCLPFDVTISGSVLDGDNVDVRMLDDAGFSDGTLTLNFTDKGAVSEIEAGRPYIIKWDNTGVNLTEQDLVFQGVTIESGTTDKTCDLGDERSITFKGTFSPTVIYEDGTEKTNLYLGSANTLYYPTTEGFALKSCRAYFKLNGLTAGEPSSPSNVRAFSLNFGDEATGIVSIGNGQLTIDNEADAWYSLGGVRLGGKPTQKGVYINNGRKVVIK